MRHDVQQLNGDSTHRRRRFNINFLADLVVRSSRTDVPEDAWVHSETAEHIPFALESARKIIAHSVYLHPPFLLFLLLPGFFLPFHHS